MIEYGQLDDMNNDDKGGLNMRLPKRLHVDFERLLRATNQAEEAFLSAEPASFESAYELGRKVALSMVLEGTYATNRKRKTT
jgi:hypothetical protein